MPNGIFIAKNLHFKPNGIKGRDMRVFDADSLGKAIRDRRKELNYTQSHLAEFTGLSITFISDVERGKKTAEIGKVLELLHVLGLDILVEKRG